MWEERKNNFAFCAAGDAGEKGAFYSILNLKVAVAQSNVTVAL